MSAKALEMEQKNIYTMTYVDDEGDSIVKHVEMTQTQALELMEELRSSGRSVSINRITGAGVTLPNEEG